MTVAYWIAASLLALFYLYSGAIKIVRSKEQLRPMMEWVDAMPLAALRTIGLLELLGAIGLIIPPLIDVAAGLAVAAAIGLVLLQLGATALHVSRNETRQIWLNLTMLALSAVTVWLATVWL